MASPDTPPKRTNSHEDEHVLKMVCPRGKAKPDTHTKFRLFSDSGGYCQKPDCARLLFRDIGSRNIHIAEIAHVFSASDGGPRSKQELTPAERGAYENLIMLCPLCHAEIDKAEDMFPDSMILSWKKKHKEKIATLFGAVEHDSRQATRNAIEGILRQNHTIFATYGPMIDERFNPESESVTLWRRKVRQVIIPNNYKILRILEANRRHLQAHELVTLENFRQHLDDLAARHLEGDRTPGGMQFPIAMDQILRD